jgi:thioester reductase-like protein
MRIAVTGATGFLGHYIVFRLASQGHVCPLLAGFWTEVVRQDCQRLGVEAVGIGGTTQSYCPR